MIRPRRLVNRTRDRIDAITLPIATIALTLTAAAFVGHLFGTLCRFLGS